MHNPSSVPLWTCFIAFSPSTSVPSCPCWIILPFFDGHMGKEKKKRKPTPRNFSVVCSYLLMCFIILIIDFFLWPSLLIWRETERFNWCLDAGAMLSGFRTETGWSAVCSFRPFRSAKRMKWIQQPQRSDPRFLSSPKLVPQRMEKRREAEERGLRWGHFIIFIFFVFF